MNDNSIKQLANPEGDQDAVDLNSMKTFVSTSTISAGTHENTFAYLLKSPSNVSAVTCVNSVAIENFSSNPHSVYKKAYSFNLEKKRDGSFNSRLKFDNTIALR